jgi:hypothetical protein
MKYITILYLSLFTLYFGNRVTIEPSRYSIFRFNKPFCQTVKKKNFYPFRFTVQDYRKVMEGIDYPIKQPNNGKNKQKIVD